MWSEFGFVVGIFVTATLCLCAVIWVGDLVLGAC